ncbi:hypothetical protein HG530_001066 [Fusarium avenaceum]|nr:hypothetical protein HG530_001066 [Fusarium avenaceum]
MPTATQYFGVAITNLGPLTTTYTAPSSCLTATTDHIQYAISGSLEYVIGSPKCTADSLGKCIPSGSVLDSMVAEMFGRQSGQGFQHYYSPGVYCPHGWTTAAVLAHGQKTDSVERSGFFTATARGNWSMPQGMRPDDEWLNILEPSETLAYCCPSGWTGVVGGNCKTSIEPFESSEFTNACYEDSPENDVVTVYTVEGESWTDSKGLLSAMPVTETQPQTTEPFTNPWTQETAVVVARNLPAIPLVFKASDVEVAKNDTKDGKDGDGKDDKNDATSRQPKLLGLAPMAALVVGILTGAGLLMPW